ncbi:hypothetical protein SERLA73DRAFT_182004 [Serpula lacrymans var. lacrymans S7.3]|uniref:Deacetylase sirtuin-type domain-containing protein n=2 Tax=Serpula lacrymans var. lacrymans TaxID=341189 RepID=F8PZ43_SERL3|nr:uncharacterized protein SERLADRAFT_449479 [Serpula lacrymans var. lacrymans S7.9]EGN99156.1 hypothetical protein SERLA73DRAFT_182004 [Serpula lacrymans var. lacrymans S7.3]EGO24725.1 hypothetical protein SERLADRAFT_449479 [Serpula lacrymans var. lacrymans S7.9]
MTVFMPLEADSSPPTSPPFLVHSADPSTQVRRVVKAIMKAKRLVVVCGAGISVKAGIPDFRSPDGLFQTLKRDNPKESLTSGKDLFDASVFNSENTTSLFCQMIAQLSELSQSATPTSFHRLLRTLDDRGGLLRVYTQNIDAIESKSGLTFGVPEFEDKRYKPRSKSKPGPSPEDLIASSSTMSPHANQSSQSSCSSSSTETPRCIPLHGTLQTLHCQTCTHSFPLEQYLPSLISGAPPYCPECTRMEETRQLVGKRPRGVGKLRPSVVLYNEMHKDGEDVGEVVRRDLVGGAKGKGRSGADVLLVVGTSLRVPGTKRIVREFAKAVKARGTAAAKDACAQVSMEPTTPIPSPRRSPESLTTEERPIKSIYLNLDFPVPTREWEGVFDAWVQGDAQDFASILDDEIEKEAAAKEAAIERKRKREENAALAIERGVEDATSTPKSGKKRKISAAASEKGPTKRKGAFTPTAKGRARTPVSAGRGNKTPVKKNSTVARQAQSENSKIMLRIPARPKLFSVKTLPVPEVYITTTVPQSLKRGKTNSPFTPPQSIRSQRNTKIKSARPSAQEQRPHYPPSDESENARYTESVLSDSESEDEEPDELPSALVRTVQYGLRHASRG